MAPSDPSSLYSDLPAYPPSLSKSQQDNLLFDLNDWAVAHGLTVRPAPSWVPKNVDPSGVLAATAPVTLFPSLFPKSCYTTALAIAQSYNELYARIAMDETWMSSVMEELVQVDDFMQALWNVHLKVKQEGYVQDLALGLFRSDYMVHVDPNVDQAKPEIRQVEFNTISSSFGGLSTHVATLHRYLQSTGAYPDHPALTIENQPSTNPTKALAAGIHAAHVAYGASRHTASPLPLCVLFVVQDSERNIFDQRHLEYQVQEAGISTFRLPFSQVLEQTQIPSDNAGRPLIFSPPHRPGKQYEVTVLYLRSTYTPTDFRSERDWEARYMLERSAAIKCPSILTHLAGAKKVQQVLATPESPHLSRFLPDPSVSKAVRATFADIYPLDDSVAGKKAKGLALDPQTAKKFVLKPQREGGGNNIYRDKIPGFLKNLGGEEKWRGHILMEIIEPPAQENAIVRQGELLPGGVIVELGVYGACLWRQSGEILHNSEAGYLLRTKGKESEEGGVAAGFGSVDSLLLVDV